MVFYGWVVVGCCVSDCLGCDYERGVIRWIRSSHQSIKDLLGF